jgi:hypothetical protein
MNFLTAKAPGAQSRRKTLASFAFLTVHILMVAVLACLLVPGIVGAQGGIVAMWETDPPPANGWTVGDAVPLRLRVTYPAAAQATLPELPAQWGPFEVRQQTMQPPKRNDNSTLTIVREASVVLWQPGSYQTPPFTITVKNDLVSVPPISITVTSVLTNTNQEKRDLKPQAVLPRPPIWPWVLAGVAGGILLLLLARWLWLRWKRRPSGARAAAGPVDTRLPEEIAYSELDHIATIDLPAQGEFKHHYTLVTDCLRAYLERVYPISALDRTSSELLADLRKVCKNGEAVMAVQSLTDEADLVKFAKLRPALDSARAAVTRARAIVDMTKPNRAASVDSNTASDTPSGAL